MIVLDTKLLTGLSDDGRDIGIVRLDYPGKEMVGYLVVECTCNKTPKPVVGRVILCGNYLHLCPAGRRQAWEGEYRKG